MAKDKQKYTPMMQQYLTIKEDHSDAIVFFRLGDFYEMFFEDALLASKELEIQLTARDGGTDERVPMCGVPHHSAESYISKLVNKGYKVAICEQTEDPSKTKNIVKRDVVRIVTPGTNIEESNAEEVYIAALGMSEHFYTIATLNASTGEMMALRFIKDKNILIGELSTLSLKELIIPHAEMKPYVSAFCDHEAIRLSIHPNQDIDDSFTHLYNHLPTDDEKRTVKRLLSYIMKTQKRALLHLKDVKRIEPTSIMKMDANTIRHLELVKTMIQNVENGSLFWLLNRTHTAMGARFLKRQILRPLLDAELLNKRYDFVEKLNQAFMIHSDLKEALKHVYDLERIVGKISYGNTNAKDLLQLRKSLEILPTFKEKLQALHLAYAEDLNDNLDPLSDTYDHLMRALKEDVPLTIKEGGMFKTGYDETLDELSDVRTDISNWLSDLEIKEKKRTGIKKLKIGYNRVFGYYIEVPKGQIKNIKESFGYIRKQTLANAERYITEDLKEKEKIILSSDEKRVEREYELFIALRDEIRQKIPNIQKNAEILAEVDMYIAFCSISETYDLIRPTLNDQHQIDIQASRHPIVEKTLEDQSFIPNDITMDDATDIFLITGPNMSGKSTYMRQLALSAIMAQIGCFVPAKKANIPIFDKVFTRIGASDDLISGKSTFMVEMLDANHAIQNATKNSLILFDEIGRGTSTYDGMAIAQAIIEYIHNQIGAKTLFSTHYHELTNLEESLKRLKNIHVAANEEEGKIIFHHKVQPGRADKSYGVNVAALANLPNRLIKRAKALLMALENQETKHYNLFTVAEIPEEDETPPPQQKLLDKLKTIEPDEMSPIEALSLLYELKKISQDRD